MQWWYTTPCGRCAKDVRIAKDASRGKSKYSASSTVKAKCASCGHEDAYPASAVDSKMLQ
jgi:RNase P subunit RPR2